MISKFTNYITRLVKGSELTWTEMDNNLNKLKDEIIDQSIRNDDPFDKVITFENNNVDVSISALILRIPLINSENVEFTEGSFILDCLFNIDSTNVNLPNWYRTVYDKRLFTSMDYPGLASYQIVPQPINEYLLNGGVGIFNEYSYQYDINGYHEFTFSINAYLYSFKSYKILFKMPDNDFNNNIYDFNNITVTEVEAKRGAEN